MNECVDAPWPNQMEICSENDMYTYIYIYIIRIYLGEYPIFFHCETDRAESRLLSFFVGFLSCHCFAVCWFGFLKPRFAILVPNAAYTLFLLVIGDEYAFGHEVVASNLLATIDLASVAELEAVDRWSRILTPALIGI